MKNETSVNDILRAKTTMNTLKTTLRDLETKKAEELKFLEEAKQLPEDAEQELQKILDRYVVGRATDGELKSSRKALADAESAYKEHEEILNACERATRSTIVAMNRAVSLYHDAVRFFWDRQYKNFSEEWQKADARDKALHLIATYVLTGANVDLKNNTSAVVGHILYNAFFPNGLPLTMLAMAQETLTTKYLGQDRK